MSQKRQRFFFFFFPFNPKHRLQLSLSFGDMNVASFTGTGLAVQCNLNNTNLSCLFRAWQGPGSVLSPYCVLPHLILAAALRSGHCRESHFIELGTEAQRELKYLPEATQPACVSISQSIVRPWEYAGGGSKMFR